MYLTECQILLKYILIRISEESVYFSVLKAPAGRINDENQS